VNSQTYSISKFKYAVSAAELLAHQIVPCDKKISSPEEATVLYHFTGVARSTFRGTDTHFPGTDCTVDAPVAANTTDDWGTISETPAKAGGVSAISLR
jgi:hypothetical protein